MQTLDKAALWKAIPASFAVYLLPLVGPHAMVMLGPSLVMAVFEGGESRDPVWIAADVALALGLQSAAGVLWYWFFRSPSGRRLLGVVAAAPLFFVIAEWCYLIALPSYFLIEPDRSPEKADWEIECTIPEYYVVTLRSGPDLALERAGQAWIARSTDSRLSILEMPGCKITELDLTWSNVSPRITYVLTGGRALYATYQRPTAREEWWYVEGSGHEPVPLEKPLHVDHAQPILSTDGQWVAWIQRIPTDGAKSVPRVLLQSLQTAAEKSVSLEELSPAGFRLIKLDSAGGELTLARNEHEFLRLTLDGTVSWGPWKPTEVNAWEDSFRLLEGGWVAWDTYQEHKDYQAAWALPEGSGTHTVLKGRGINSLAVDPAGKHIALSVDGRYSIGDVKDSVYVLRVADGAEVFRRYMAPYSRSHVAFLGSGVLPYTEGRDVRVLRAAASPQGAR